MFEVLFLALALVAARLVRLLFVATMNVVCIGGPAILVLAVLQHYDHGDALRDRYVIDVGLTTEQLFLFGGVGFAIAASRVLFLGLGDTLIRSHFQKQRERLRKDAKDRRAFRIWSGYSGLSWQQFGELWDNYNKLQSDEDAAYSQHRQNFWGPWWTLAIPAVFACGLSFLPCYLLSSVLHKSAVYLWSNRRYTPEVIFCAVPFAAMFGVTLLPSWWWALAFVPVGYAYLLVVATATQTYFRWCAARYNSQFCGLPESWGQSFDAVLKTHHLWGRWQTAPWAFIVGVPVALVIWTGYGWFNLLNSLIGSWAAMEFSIIIAAILSIGLYATPAVLIFRRVQAWMKRLEAKPASEFAWTVR